VDPIFQEGVTATGTNLTAVIESFRYQMQRSAHTNASIERGQWWFDNMTLYLDTLLIIQQVCFQFNLVQFNYLLTPFTFKSDLQTHTQPHTHTHTYTLQVCDRELNRMYAGLTEV
jgi:hypothetical protein